MDYYIVWTQGDAADRTLAFFEDAPAGLELRDFYLREGTRLGDHYPAGASMHMAPHKKGLKLSSMLGNTLRFLLVETAMKQVIESEAHADIEYLPVSIYNHKKRLQSSDYWIINPIGTIDCVDRDRSEIFYQDDTKQQVVGVGELVLSLAQLQAAEATPHLFRVPEKPSLIIASSALCAALQDHQFSNVVLKRLETS